MMFTDPIADLIIRIKNANRARHPNCTINTSKITSAILEVLKSEGYIENYETKKNNKSNVTRTIITLKFKDQVPAISGIKQISKPGLRIYQESKKLPRVLSGLGVAIISTSQGVVTDKFARTNNLGGEVIAYVW
ncbi:MAG: 30S ribosomal protein S8 [Mycoplasmataceae bacterium]|nr:30S ribosomal protein S8 [Mycoplasmataceae bacterium]